MKTETENTRRLNILGNDDTSSVRDTLPAMLRRWGQGLGYFSMFAALPAFLASDTRDARAEIKAPAPPETAAGQREKRPVGTNRRLGRPDFLARQSNYLLPHQQGNPNIANAFTGGDNCPGVPVPDGAYTGAAPFTDSGDTSGGNNTITHLEYYYYAGYGVTGPDHVYTFTLTSRGASPEIRVTPSANFDPAIYVLNGRYGACPAGTANHSYSWQAFSNTPAVGVAETLNAGQLSYLPLNVPHYLFIDSNATAPANSGQYTVTMKDVTIAPGPRTKFDFDRDGRADLSVFRPSDSTWYVNRLPQGFSGTQFGLATDRLVPADYDGDGRTDIAVFRDGVWYWINSANGTLRAFSFGSPGDIPQPADYDGDGRAELAVYRNGIWYTQNLQSNRFGAVPFGLAGDKPVVGDYDGDGRSDYAVFRNGTWYLLQSQRGLFSRQFGVGSDKLVPADYDGDDRTDIAVYRDGVWHVQLSWDVGYRAFQFGSATDIPAPIDYNGFGYANLAFYRDGAWHVRNQFNNSLFPVFHFGAPGDRPVPSALLPQ